MRQVRRTACVCVCACTGGPVIEPGDFRAARFKLININQNQNNKKGKEIKVKDDSRALLHVSRILLLLLSVSKLGWRGCRVQGRDWGGVWGPEIQTAAYECLL